MRSLRRCFGLGLATMLLAGAVRSTAQSGAAPRAALERGDIDGAIASGEAAVAKNPADAEAWSLLGSAYARKAQSASIFSQLGLAKKSRAAFERAVELVPGSVEARSDLIDFYLEAPGIAGGSIEKAKEQAREIAKLDALAGHLVLGRVLAKDKDFAAAEAELKQALAGDATGVPAPLALGALYIEEKRWADAEALWQKRLEDDPKDMLAHYQLARLALFSGSNLDQGVTHLKAYLAVPALPERPTWADAHWRLALLYEKLGRKADAVAELRVALRLDPAHRQAKKDLDRIGG